MHDADDWEEISHCCSEITDCADIKMPERIQDRGTGGGGSGSGSTVRGVAPRHLEGLYGITNSLCRFMF